MVVSFLSPRNIFVSLFVLLLAGTLFASFAAAADTLAPSVTVYRNPQETVFSGTVLTLTGSALDASGIAYTKILYNVGDATQSRTCYNAVQCSVEVSPLQAGTVVRYWAEARDDANNFATTDIYYVTINPVSFTPIPSPITPPGTGSAPTATVTRTPVLVTTSDRVTLSAQGFDDNAVRYTFIKYRLGSGTEQVSVCTGSTCSTQLNFLQAGVTVSYHAEAQDYDELRGSSSIYSFTVQSAVTPTTTPSPTSTPSPGSDVTVPSLNVYRTPIGQVTPITQITIYASATDLSGIASTELFYRANNGPEQHASCTSSVCSAFIGNLPSGSIVSFKGKATDSSARANSVESPWFSYIVTGTDTSRASATVHASDCSTNAPLAGATVLLDGAITTTNSNGDASFAGLPTGSQELTLIAGNHDQAGRIVTLVAGSNALAICAQPINNNDPTNTPPSVTVTRNPSGVVPQGATVTFNAAASDSNGILWTRVVYSRNGASFTGSTCYASTCSTTLFRLTAGDVVSYYATAKDAAVPGATATTQIYSFAVGGTGVTPTPSPTPPPSVCGLPPICTPPQQLVQTGLRSNGCPIWSCQNQVVDTALVTTHVTSCFDNSPIASAFVAVDGRTASTDFSGNAVLANVANGTQTITITAPNYNTFTGTVNVVIPATAIVQCLSPITTGDTTGALCALYSSNNRPLANTQVNVTVNLTNYSTVPISVPVNCGNGVILNAPCVASIGPENASCTVECTYAQQGSYTAYSTAAGVRCDPTTLSVQPAITQANQSTLLVIVYDRDTGVRLQGSHVNVSGISYWTNSLGEATARVAPGTHFVSASLSGYNSSNTTIAVAANEQKQVQLALAYSRTDCDFTAELITTSCNSGTANAQLRLENLLGSDNNLSVSFSSLYTVAGPASIALSSGQTTIQNYSIASPLNYAGSQTAVATVSGHSCSRTFTIPLCSVSDALLSVEVRNPEVDALPESRACTGVIVRNNAAYEQVIDLTASTGLRGEFDRDKLYLYSHSSTDVQYCVNVPSGADGAYDVTIQARSNAASAIDNFRVNVNGNSAFYLNYTSCTNRTTVSQTVTVDVTASNYYSRSISAVVNPDSTNVAAICMLQTSSGDDATAPEITLYTSPQAIVYAGNPVSITAAANDSSGISLTEVLYQIDSGPTQRQSCTGVPTCTISFTAPQGSTITYWGRAQDSSGRANLGESSHQSFAVTDAPTDGRDFTPPTVSISRSPSGSLGSSDSVTFTATANDATGVREITIYYKLGVRDWQNVNCFATQCTYTLSPQAQGTTVIYYATAKDSSNQANTGLSGFSYYNVGPTLFAGHTVGGLDVVVTDCATGASITGAQAAISANRVTTGSDGVASFGRASFDSSTECSCIPITAAGRTTEAITLENSGPGGNFETIVESDTDALTTSINQAYLSAFSTGAKRTVYLNIDVDNAAAGRHGLTFTVRDAATKTPLSARNICVDVARNQQLEAYFEPNNFLVAFGGTFTTKLNLANQGNTQLDLRAQTNTNYSIPKTIDQFLSFGESASRDVTIDTRTAGDVRETRIIEVANRGNTTIDVTTALLGFDAYSAQIVSPTFRKLEPGQAANFTVTVIGGLARGHYNLPYDVIDKATERVIKTVYVTFDVVSVSQISQRTVAKGVQIVDAFVEPLPSTGSRSITAVIRNNNAYTVEGIALYASQLPPGVTTGITPPVTLQPFEEKTVFISLQSFNAPEGLYTAHLKLDTPESSNERPFSLRIGNKNELGLEITVPNIEYSFGNETTAIITLSVRNTERQPLDVSAYFLSLPSYFVSNVEPFTQHINPGATANYTLTARTAQTPVDFNTTLSAEATGLRKTITVPLAFEEARNAGGATGLFGAGLSADAWFWILVIMLIVAAAFFFAAASRNRATANDAQRQN